MLDWEQIRPNDPIHNTAFGELSEADDYQIYDHDQLTNVIDIGANVGYFALKVLETWPDCKIDMYESDPQNFDLLMKNVRHFGFDKMNGKLRFNRLAVWSEVGGVHIEGGYGGTSHVLERVEGPWVADRIKTGEPVWVPSITLNEILATFDEEVDLLKMDVEGAEYEILRTVDSDQLAKCRFIAMELHDWYGPDRREELEAKIEATHQFTLKPPAESSGIILAERKS